jgi:exodeoxyribonuclease-3
MPTRTRSPKPIKAHRPLRARRTRAAQAHTGRGLRLLTFNIGAAAVPRATDVLRWLRRRKDDVIVLSETSSGPGTELLREGLKSDGYATFATANECERGVLLATRVPVKRNLAEISVTLPCRAEGIILDTSPQVALIGVYVPSRDRSEAKVRRKEEFIHSLLESIRALPSDLQQRLLLLGDYNAVARHHDPVLPGFFPYEYEFHDELAEIGLSAAHELRPYGAHPHSWIGRTGNRYLYDYAHVGGALGNRIERCQYLHGPRERRLSDHAAVAVRLGLD